VIVMAGLRNGVKRYLAGERAADLVLWVAITVPVFLTNLDDDPAAPAGLPLLWLQIAAVPLLGFAVAVGRRRPVMAAAVPVGLGFAATPELGSESDSFLVPLIVLAFLLGRRTSRMRPGLWFFAGVNAAGLMMVLRPDVGLDDWFSTVGNVLLAILLPWLAGRYAHDHAELVRRGWELAQRLEREQYLTGERMRLLERSRIAGDMHDSLGHELSLIALRAAALQVGPGLDADARKAAGELRASAAAATGRLRELIGVLRQDGDTAPLLPTGDSVAALVERAAASGMDVTLQGELGPLPPMADRAAYRAVQEALTNATKHAPGAAVTVTLATHATAGEAVIAVTNTAPPAAPAQVSTSAGYGLVGLDERVRLAGGRLHAHRTGDGGFTVTARLPLTAGAAATPPGPQQELASTQQLAQARRKVRRTMVDALWLTAAAAVLLVLLFAYDQASG
jgi:signal transduction histidine kinase